MKTSNALEEREIDVRELFHAVFHKIWIVFLSGIGLAVLLFYISYYVMEWKYESTTQIYILSNQDGNSEINYTNFEISSYLIKDYMILATSRLVTSQVITKIGLDMEHEELVKLIRVENPDETRIININVKYKDPVIAKLIADEIRETTTGLITLITKNEQESRIIEANVPESPTSPNIKYNTLLGGAVGVVISTFIIVLCYLSNDTLKSFEDIEKYLDLRVLCTIPKAKEKKAFRKKKSTIKKKKKKSTKIKSSPSVKSKTN